MGEIVQMSKSLCEPCPVCNLVLDHARHAAGVENEPCEGAYTVCFGCGLVQVIHDGKRVALTEDEADLVFDQPALLAAVLTICKLRAVNPHRVSEILAQQRAERN